MKRPEKICVNPQCREKIIYYKSTKRKFCSASCKNSYHYDKKLEEHEVSITNDRAIKRLVRFLKEMQEFEIESFKIKKESFFFKNIIFPSKKQLNMDNGQILYVIQFDNILINLDDKDNSIKIINYEHTKKSFN